LSPQILSRYFDLHQFSYISGKPEDFDENQIDGTLYLSANFTPDQIDRYTNLLPWSLWGNVRLIQNISAISLPEDTICISKNIKGCLYPQLVPAGVSINKFVYSSTDESIVRINEMGEYTAIGNGEADIIISSYVQKDINKKCHVIVNGARPVIPDSTSCLLYEPFEYDSSTNQIILRHNWNSAMGHIGGNLWSHTDNPDLFGLTDYNLISDTLSFAGGDLYLSILTDNPLKIVIGEKSQTILPSKEQTSYLISDASKRVVYIFKNVPANPVLKIRVFSTANIKELKVWDPTTISYPINFVNDDGTVLWSDTILYGETPIYYGELPNKPSSAQYIYSFAGWSPNIEVVTGNATYTAVYDSIVCSYLVTFTDEIGNILQQTWVEYGQLPIYNGATPTKSATAQYTYIFKGWDKEIVAVETTTTYTAKLDTIINQFTIDVFAEDGSVTGAGTYDYGTEVTLTATPNEGYEFDNWSNGITDNPYTFIVEQDVELTANFIKKFCTSWQDINSEIKVIKYFENERLIIERNGIRYNAYGARVK
ncbi:MAG: hypothetical protein KBS42_02800, partial [Bacteroidales bacterium]|nr:hypothetical protein [Candidatus Colicola coprequi]